MFSRYGLFVLLGAALASGWWVMAIHGFGEVVPGEQFGWREAVAFATIGATGLVVIAGIFLVWHDLWLSGYDSTMLRQVVEQIKVVEVPPGAAFVLEMREGQVSDEESVRCFQREWSRIMPGTTFIALQDGIKLRAILSGIPEVVNDTD